MSAAADIVRMCPCGCGPIPANKRADAKWADKATCPQRAKDRAALGLRSTDKPAAFWEGYAYDPAYDPRVPLARPREFAAAVV